MSSSADLQQIPPTHPLMMPRLALQPRARAFLQVFITFVMVLALYCAWYATPRVLDSMSWSGQSSPVAPPAWAMVLIPILAIIPGAYVFMFLKYNFVH